jgi:hypothetical protein
MYGAVSKGRALARTGLSGLMIVTIMVVGSLVLWVAIPLGWLWVGSQIQGSTGNIGTALAVMMGGVVASVLPLAALLSWLNRRQEALRESRGLPRSEHSVLERVLVVTAAFAVVAFSVWFLGFAGPGPSLAPQ